MLWVSLQAGVCFREETPSVNWWYLSYRKQSSLTKTSYRSRLRNGSVEWMLCPVRQLKLYLRDLERIRGWGFGRRPSKRLTHELIGSTTTELHVRGRYLTFCQLRFGGHRESSRIPICETWLVSLMGCQLWVQWWSHNKSWIQDISHLP